MHFEVLCTSNFVLFLFVLDLHIRQLELMRIYLIGMPGTGKTYWAQRISVLKNIDWIDLDAEIEKESNLSIQAIFETEGEAVFRKKEAEALRKLVEFKNIVIATGGGAPCFHDNMKVMNETGVTIWIDESVEVLVERLKAGRDHRPMIRGMNDDQLIEFVERKLKERESFYSLAQYRLNDRHLNQQEIIKIIEQHA